MNSFFYILQKHMVPGYNIRNKNTENLFAFWKHMCVNKAETTNSAAINMYYYFYVKKCRELIQGQSDLIIYFKFREYKNLLDNIFLQCHGSPEYVQDVFCKAQKTYRAFSKLARIFLSKRAPLQVNHDMYMNPIDLKNRNTMIIFQNKARYAFKLSDLINILNSALAHSPHFFSDPLFPKNPYTNIEFEMGALYEIYDRIKKSDYKMPILIQAFFCAEFDIDKFAYDNEASIRDISITDYVKTSTNDTLVPEIKSLFRAYDKLNRIKINKEFPADRLVHIMRPYLHLYYINQFSLYETTKRADVYTELNKKMRRFIEFNPRFGRKIMKEIDANTLVAGSSFYDKHPDFNEPVDNIPFIDLSEDEDSDS